MEDLATRLAFLKTFFGKIQYRTIGNHRHQHRHRSLQFIYCHHGVELSSCDNKSIDMLGSARDSPSYQNRPRQTHTQRPTINLHTSALGSLRKQGNIIVYTGNDDSLPETRYRNVIS